MDRARRSSASLLVIALVLLAMPARGEDVAVVAAAVPDEASECRYLLGFCQDFERWKRQTTYVGKAPPPPVPIDGPFEAEHGEYRHRQEELRTIARIVRAKHDKMPACFEQCGPEL